VNQELDLQRSEVCTTSILLVENATSGTLVVRKATSLRRCNVSYQLAYLNIDKQVACPTLAKSCNASYQLAYLNIDKQVACPTLAKSCNVSYQLAYLNVDKQVACPTLRKVVT